MIDDEKPEAPAETPEAETPEKEDGALGDGDDSQAAPKSNKVSAKKRIKELTKAYRSTEREKEYWREQALKQGEPKPVPQKAQEVVPGKPHLAQFNYDQEQYLEALADWKTEEKLAQRDKTAKEAEAAKVAQSKAITFQAKLAKFEERAPGAWDEITRAPMNTNSTMLEFVQESDKGLDVAHYLAQHTAEANSISQMSAYLATKALEGIATKLKPVEYTDDDEGDEDEAEEAEPIAREPTPKAGQPKVTQASEPPVTVTTTSATKKPLDRWTVADHIAAVKRNKKR